MAINDKSINWIPSPSLVETYRVYHVPSDGQDIEVVDGNNNYVAPYVSVPGTQTSGKASELLGLVEGTFDIGITALDLNENESAMSIFRGLEVDFVAPDPPGAITVTDLPMD